jgi:hypothetical protein
VPGDVDQSGGKSEAKRRVRGRRERARGGSKMGKELLWQRPRAGIRTNPRGAAATDGHRRQAALQAVSMVTEGGHAGPGTGPGGEF